MRRRNGGRGKSHGIRDLEMVQQSDICLKSQSGPDCRTSSGAH